MLTNVDVVLDARIFLVPWPTVDVQAGLCVVKALWALNEDEALGNHVLLILFTAKNE